MRFLPDGYPNHLNADRTVRTDPRDQPRLWTPRQNFVWDKASFTVPITFSEERVQDSGDKYRFKYAKELWRQGFEILGMEGPYEDRSVVAVGMTDPDRRKYVIRAKVRRAPQEVRVEVPDADVSTYQQAGYKLV